jgi:hypothetical protein
MDRGIWPPMAGQTQTTGDRPDEATLGSHSERASLVAVGDDRAAVWARCLPLVWWVV